jgi:hypothetical protein
MQSGTELEVTPSQCRENTGEGTKTLDTGSTSRDVLQMKGPRHSVNSDSNGDRREVVTPARIHIEKPSVCVRDGDGEKEDVGSQV